MWGEGRQMMAVKGLRGSSDELGKLVGKGGKCAFQDSNTHNSLTLTRFQSVEPSLSRNLELDLCSLATPEGRGLSTQLSCLRLLGPLFVERLSPSSFLSNIGHFHYFQISSHVSSSSTTIHPAQPKCFDDLLTPQQLNL